MEEKGDTGVAGGTTGVAREPEESTTGRGIKGDGSQRDDTDGYMEQLELPEDRWSTMVTSGISDGDIPIMMEMPEQDCRSVDKRHEDLDTSGKQLYVLYCRAKV